MSLTGTIDSWITPSRLRGYPIVFIGFGVLIIALTATRPPLAGDFLAHWTGGRMILDGSTSVLYDPYVQQAVQAGIMGPHDLVWFVSPPFAAYFYAPFAVFGYQVAAILWTLFSMGCMVAAAWLVRPFAPRLFRDHQRVVYVAMASTWPVVETLGGGQDAGVSVLIWVAGLRLLMAGRDFAGGAVLALGLMKPHLFFVVPFVLIAQRRWRALGAWAATATGLALVSVQTVGIRGVTEWLRLPFSDRFHEAVQVGQAWKMQSLPALVESFGLERAGLVVAVIGFGVLLCQLWMRGGSVPIAMWMLAIVATVAISPHVLIYDLLVLLVPILWMLEHHNTRRLRLACVALFVLTWTIYVRHIVGAPVDAAWSALGVCALWIFMSARYRRDLTEGRSAKSGNSRAGNWGHDR